MWYGVSLFWIGRARRHREVVQLGGMNHVQIDQINQTLNLARINKHFLLYLVCRGLDLAM